MPETGVNRNIAAVIVINSIPVIVFATLNIFWLMVALWRLCTAKLWHQAPPSVPHLPFGTKVLVSAIVVAFFFYESWLTNIMVIFQCDTLDGGTGNRLALDAGLNTSPLWARDYSVKCYQGQHRVLMFSLGIPGLAIIGILIPLGTAWWLTWNRSRLHTDADFVASWGILYRTYTKKYYAWESFIMVQKLLVTAVLVLLVGQPNGVQVLVAVALLNAGLIVHLLCRPFRAAKVQGLKTLADTSIVVTLYISLYFTYGEAPDGYRAFSIALVVVNSSTIVIFISFMLIGSIMAACSKAGLGIIPGITQQQVAENLRPTLRFMAPPAAWVLTSVHSTATAVSTISNKALEACQSVVSQINSKVMGSMQLGSMSSKPILSSGGEAPAGTSAPAVEPTYPPPGSSPSKQMQVLQLQVAELKAEVAAMKAELDAVRRSHTLSIKEPPMHVLSGDKSLQ